MPVVVLHPVPGRQLRSWIAGFMEYTKAIWSTDPFRRWSAIMAIAGALERRVWIRSQSQDIYPNMYVFLVGPPAAGKTRAASICEQFWRTLPHTDEYDFHLAPTSLTKAALMDSLSDAKRNDPRLEAFGQPGVYNSLLIVSKELGALIPTYDADFLNALTYIYDNEAYSEKRRSIKEEMRIERPQINLLGCTTPSFLCDTIPHTAWDQGFLSRVIIIFQDIIQSERELNLMQEELPRDHALGNALRNDIKAISEVYGKFKFEQSAADCIVKWEKDAEIKPGHPRLQNYVTRRAIHALKLCMIACVDRGGTGVIELEDAQAAISWLTEAEENMGDMFLAFKTGGDANVMDEARHFLMIQETRLGKKGEPMAASVLYDYLAMRVPSYRIQAVVDTMARGKRIFNEVHHGVPMIRVNANWTDH